MKHYSIHIRRDISVSSALRDEMVIEQDREHLGKDFIKTAYAAMCDTATRFPGEVIYAVFNVEDETIAVAHSIPYIDVNGMIRRNFSMLSYTGSWNCSTSHWNVQEVS